MDLLEIINQNENSLSHLFNSSNQVIKRIKICGDCSGAGFTEVTTHHGHARGHEVANQVCATCSGTGRLDIEITIRINPHKQHYEETNG